jgi:hypothetical protein
VSEWSYTEVIRKFIQSNLVELNLKSAFLGFDPDFDDRKTFERKMEYHPEGTSTKIYVHMT